MSTPEIPGLDTRSKMADNEEKHIRSMEGPMDMPHVMGQLRLLKERLT